MLNPANYDKKLNIGFEFNCMYNYIKKTWQFSDNKHVKQALADAFNEGLKDGRMWIDEYSCMMAGEVIAGEMNYLASKRLEECTDDDYVSASRDALYIFENALSSGLYKLNRNEIDNFRFSTSSNALCRVIKEKYPSIENCNPIEISEEKQLELISLYPGFKADGARTQSTPERLSYNEANYGNINQGRGFFYTLISSMYAHGLGCAQERNDREILRTIIPIYKKFLEQPLCSENGDEIMKMARKNELMPFIESIAKFKFHKGNEAKIGSTHVESFDEEKFINEMIEEIKKEDLKVDEKKAAEKELADKISEFKKTLPVLEVTIDCQSLGFEP